MSMFSLALVLNNKFCLRWETETSCCVAQHFRNSHSKVNISIIHIIPHFADLYKSQFCCGICILRLVIIIVHFLFSTTIKNEDCNDLVAISISSFCCWRDKHSSTGQQYNKINTVWRMHMRSLLSLR